MRKIGISTKIALVVAFVVFSIIISIGAGSVSVRPGDIVSIIGNKLFNLPLGGDIIDSTVSIVWDIRMPRVFSAFAVGAMLSISGAVMQSLLQNPLASSYTLGVSSGASLGAAIIIVSEISIPVLGLFLLPITGFAFGLATVLIVIFFSSRLDSNLRNHTIILFGMVLSLFVNAILTMLSAYFSQHIQRLTLWTMGTFSGRKWIHVALLMGFFVAGMIAVLAFHRDMDLLNFGEEQALAMGVDTKKVKFILLLLSSMLTGASVCFTGIIGFIDLTVPHIARKIFGSSHGMLIPMSAFLGGGFMALADLLARTVLAPREIPVGAITALVGAPFFLWVYLGGRKKV